MKRPSKLVRLILDFYRENLPELQQLKPLEQCQVFRRWGVLHIRCQSQKTAQALLDARVCLEAPILQLQLVRKIKILVGRTPVALFTVGSDEPIHPMTGQLSHE